MGRPAQRHMIDLIIIPITNSVPFNAMFSIIFWCGIVIFEVIMVIKVVSRS